MTSHKTSVSLQNPQITVQIASGGIGDVTEIENTTGSASGLSVGFKTSVGISNTGIDIEVTGEAGKTINWTATVETLQLHTR